MRTPTKKERDALILLNTEDCFLSLLEIAEKLNQPFESVRSRVGQLYKNTDWLNRKKIAHFPGGKGSGSFHYEYSVTNQGRAALFFEDSSNA